MPLPLPGIQKRPTTGIAQGIDNIAAALMGQANPNQMAAQAALTEDRQAHAELRRAQLAKFTADLTAKQEERNKPPEDTLASIAEAMLPGLGPMIAKGERAGWQEPPPIPMDDDGNAFPKVPMARPDGYNDNMRRDVLRDNRIVTTGRMLKGTTYDKGAKGLGELQEQDLIKGALDGLYTPEQTRNLAAVQGGMKGNKQFDTTAQGITTDLYRGTSDQGGPLTTSIIGEHGAKAGAAQAQAGKYRAQAGAVSTGGGAEGAGGKGFDTLQDPQTGQRWLYNKSTGEALTMNEDGTRTPVAAANIPKTAMRMGNIGTAGARENVFAGRIGTAAGQATADLENIARLPTSASTGLFGGRKQGPGLLDAAKDVLANTVTGQEAQSYNVKAAGIQRNLAAIEAAGLMPSGNLTHQMDAVMWREGDTQRTKLEKLAQTRQIIESGIDHVLENPRISDPEKAKLREYKGRLMSSVPYTHAELDGFFAEQERNPALTLNQFMGKMKRQPARATHAPASAPNKGAAGRTVNFADLPP